MRPFESICLSIKPVDQRRMRLGLPPATQIAQAGLPVEPRDPVVESLDKPIPGATGL